MAAFEVFTEEGLRVTRMVGGPGLKEWLQKKMEKTGLTTVNQLHNLSDKGDRLDRKTINKMLQGSQVSKRTLNKLASVLGVSLPDIPTN